MSYFESKKLREEKAESAASLTEIVSRAKQEQRAMTGEEIQHCEKLNDIISDLDQKIKSAEIVERADKLSVDVVQRAQDAMPRSWKVGPQAITKRDQELALRSWLFTASGNQHLVDADMAKAAEKFEHRSNTPSLSIPLKNHGCTSVAEYRAQTAGVAGEGGNLLLSSGTLMAGFEELLLDFGGIRSVATVNRVSKGDSKHIAVSDDTASKAVIVGENTTVTNTSLSFTKRTMTIYKYSSLVEPISLEIATDSEVPFINFTLKRIAERLARGTEEHYAVGSGTGQPAGLMTDSSLGYTLTGSAATAVPDYDSLLSLEHSVDRGYRRSRNCVWVMTDGTLREIRSMVNSNGDPIWQPGLQVGAPDNLLGYRVVVCNDLDDLGAVSKKVIGFGDASAYNIYDVGSADLRVLNELFIQDGSIGVIGFMRTGGLLHNTAAFKHMLTPAA